MSQWLIEKAGVKETVLLNGKAAEALLSPMLADLQAQVTSTSVDIEISVGGGEGEWQLRDAASKVTRTFKQAGDLIYHLSDRILFHIADQATSVHCVHAAAVAANGRAMMIPGNSGAGKSSFTAWLVANGFDYLSDELILLEGSSVSGIARPIQIKAAGIDAIRPLLTSAGAVITGQRANAVFAADLGGAVSCLPSHQLAAFVYPRYKAHADFSFTDISSAEAGMGLMENHVNARNLHGHGFRSAMQQIRSTPCYRLEYGGFDTLPTGFSDRLRGILEGGQ